MAVDALVILTGFITTLAALASWPVTFKLFYFLLLAMYGGQVAVFAVKICCYFSGLGTGAGSGILSALDLGVKAPIRGDRSSFSTQLGSLFILVAALMMAFYGDTLTFDMRSLAAKDYALNFQLWVYAGFLIAYAGAHLPTTLGSRCPR